MKEVATVLPQLAPVAPVKLVPVIVTVVPVAAEVGVNAPTTGVCANNKLGVKMKRSITTLLQSFISLFNWKNSIER